MKLKNIIKNITSLQVKGNKDVTITGLTANSKNVAPGNLFIAKKGKTFDGVQYIPEAIEGGAAAILTDIYNPSLKQITQLIHPNVSQIEARVAAEYYQYPSNDLFMVGITGTNGKTTTAFVVKHLLDQFHGPCGLIGTIEYIIGNNRYKAVRTSPDVISNYKMLMDMVNHGCQSGVMEVTSHALDQGRVELIDFDVAIFSNLSLDHLDYHGTMDNYCSAKNKFFRKLGSIESKKNRPKMAIINADSSWSKRISEGCTTQIMTYGIENKADLQATNIRLGAQGTELDVLYQGKKWACRWPLVGRFNVYNCLSAIGAALAKGVSMEAIIDRMATLPSVRGRLEPVLNDLNIKIYVDFAHSDDALINVLETLQEFKEGRIITVFGCGGDRDRTKRPKMAAASEKYSDFTFVTSDNPRSEAPETICSAIASGFSKNNYSIVIDRQEAIKQAILMANENDIILIAGKGHETNQVFAHKTIEFDDVKVAHHLCGEIANLHCSGVN